MFKQFNPLTDIFLTSQKIFEDFAFIEYDKAVDLVLDFEPTEPPSGSALGVIVSEVGNLSDLFSIEYGQSVESTFSGSYNVSQKQAIYKKYLQLLEPGSDQFTIGSTSLNEVFFINLNRSIKKDELRRGLTEFGFASASGSISGSVEFWFDKTANIKRNLNGEFNYLNLSGSTTEFIGLVHYNAGVLVLDANSLCDGGISDDVVWSGSNSLYDCISSTGSDLSVETLSGFYDRLNELAFQNQQNIFINDFYCRAHPNEFNYSSNPTYIDSDGNIVLFEGTTPSDKPDARTFVTTVGLYDAQNNLLAVAKLSNPQKKTFSNEIALRARLVY